MINVRVAKAECKYSGREFHTDAIMSVCVGRFSSEILEGDKKL